MAVLGLFTYDARPHRDSERRLTGLASPGETLTLTPTFRARPVVIAHPPLSVRPGEIARDRVIFSGDGPGTYEVIGE